MADRRFRVTDITAAAAFALVLGISCVWGMYERGNAAGRGEGTVHESADAPSGAGISSGSGETGAGNASGQPGGSGGGKAAEGSLETSPGNLVPVLDQRQDMVAGDIMKALDQGKLEEAARIISKEDKTLQDMFYTTMEGERYLYDGKGLVKELKGQGMVFTMPGKVYYGTFKDGKPEGRCTALQVVNLDAPRYDYSEGMWKEGKMEGAGHMGYCYYEWSPEGEVRDICKAGTFSGDFMDGEVTYSCLNEEDETATWKLEADKGVTVTDDRWEYVESTGEYQLLSEDSDSHGYVLSREQIRLPIWKNLLVWEE